MYLDRSSRSKGRIGMKKTSSLFQAIQKFRVIDLPIMENKLRKEEKRAKELKYLIKKVPDFSFENLKKILIIAIDGGLASSDYEGISLAIATAYTFSTRFNEKDVLEQVDAHEILHGSPNEPSLTFSLAMKALEYRVANQVLQKIEKLDKNCIFLFDGAFSFPEEGPGPASNKNINKTYENFRYNVNTFFDRILELNDNQRQVLPVAISKDALAGKYLKALCNFAQKSDIESIEQVPDRMLSPEQLSKFLEEFHERFYFNIAMWNLEKIRTIALDITGATRLPIPITKLGKGNIFGFYLKPYKYARPFYVEITKQNISSIDLISSLISYLSLISPKLGYPYPLVYVDRLARLREKDAKPIFKMIENEGYKRLGKRFGIIFNKKFGESVKE